MSETVEETGLWSRARSGDGRAFSALFDRHRDRVFRHALRLTPTPSDAEDVVAAAFLELWRRRDRVAEVDGSVLPWLLVTAANLARNASRGVRRHRAVLDRLDREPDPADPAETAEHRAARGELLAALRGLSRSDATLLVLVGLEGWTPAEAARALGIADGAARVRLHRARRRARALLGAADAGAAPQDGGVR